MIRGRYVLVSHIPLYREGKDYFVDELWHRDLLGHLPFVGQLVLAAPCFPGRGKGALRLPTGSGEGQIECVELPAVTSTRDAILRSPLLMRRLWREVGNADIVHAHVIGWPIPSAWYGRKRSSTNDNA